MPLRLNALLIALVVFAMPVLADNPGQGPYSSIPTDLYTSPLSSGAGGIPSGGINLVPGASSNSNFYYVSGSAPINVTTTTLLGCGGVGQSEYTSALYNMPESFGKFQQDVDSQLSRQLLVMNYTMPQTAALFDQLNNYGSERYQSFQKGCNVAAIQQDAKNQYLNSCVGKLVESRKAIIKQNMTGSSAPNDTMLNSMAYAQAWEICSNFSVSNTIARDTRADTLESFAKKTRQLENVTLALEPLMCNFSDIAQSSSSVGSTLGTGCWPTMLLPQVRICLDPSLGCEGFTNASGDASKGYGVKEPQVAMSRLNDLMRYYLDEIIVTHRIIPFHQALYTNGVSAGNRRLAGQEAGLALSAATYTRNDVSAQSISASTIKGSVATTQPDIAIRDFQFNYLNCKDPNILTPLDILSKQLAIRTDQKVVITVTPTVPYDVKKIVTDTFSLKDVYGSDGTFTDTRDVLGTLAYTAVGCTANQSVPFLDPNIVMSVDTCSTDDRNAYYQMAENDVAIAATRDVYRYLSIRLKQAYTQLLVTGMTPSPTIVPTSGAAVSATISPELNNKMATAVKEIMIPYVESQLERIDDINKARGQFAQRTQSIYKSRGGCMGLNRVAPQSSGSGSGGGGGGGF